MPNPLKSVLLGLQRRLTTAYGTDISSPQARRAAWWHFQLMDHAFLRVWWKNLDQVAPGVWRSNQPAPADLKRLADQGLKTVLNLRGASNQGFYLFEAEACAQLGLTLINLPLSAKFPPKREQLLALIDLFDQMERPVLIHCKSGADRTGLAAAIWRMVKQGDDATTAGAQLSWRYAHLKREASGVQDQILRSFAASGEMRGQSFRDWVAQDYDPLAVRAAFAAYLQGPR